MKVNVVIPARYASSRFPGKPLVLLNGKPMILHVAEKASLAVGQSQVVITTDHDEIESTVLDAGYNVIRVDEAVPTGTDRVALAAKKLDADVVVNVQGDEPMLDPKDITKVIAVKKQHMDQVINGFCWLSSGEEPSNKNIPKIVTNANNQLLYASRSMVPGIKDVCVDQVKFKKQVCIYAFTPEELNAFYQYGRIDPCEMLEDIEILRFMIMGRQVMMVETSTGSLAVDVREDVPIVEEALLG